MAASVAAGGFAPASGRLYARGMQTFVAVHGYVIGFLIIGAWATICFWALALRFTRYEETPTFWKAVSVAQILLVLQLLLGVVLLARWAATGCCAPAGNALDDVFHPLYGAIFPFVVLFFAHKWAREGRWNAHGIFSVAGLVIFGLTARAWMVGALAGG
jgi:hypothetical protein